MTFRTAILVSAIAAGAFASPALAGIDFNATAGGGAVTSGGREQIESYGLANALYDANNRLVPDRAKAPEHGLVDAAEATPAADAGLPLGVLLTGPHGTLYTYDRLVAKPVLQLIGFDHSAPADAAAQEPVTETPPLTLITGIGGRAASLQLLASVESSPPSFVPTPPVVPPVVPEASSITLLGVGAVLLWATLRPSRETKPAA